MSLFQRPAETPEELEASAPVDVAPERVLELDDEEWYARIRRPNAVQLTTRAVVLGSVLGFFLSFTNVYIGLKTGWFLGVSLTAALVSYSVWNWLVKLGLVRSKLSILESTTVVSTASSAGYATGFTLISAFPAMLLLSGQQLPAGVIAAWVFFLGVLGVTLAIPMKRTMINRERLRFPSGTAAAIMLHGLHRRGVEVIHKTRALLGAALLAGVIPLLKDLALFRNAEGARAPLIAGQSKIFDGLARLGPWQRLANAGPPRLHPAGAPFVPSDYLLRLDHGPALVFAGVLIGLRVTAWMLVGALVVVFALAPVGLDWEWTNGAGRLVTAVTRPGSAWRDIGIWSGAPLLVASSLVALASQWRTIGRAIAGLRPGAWKAEAPREEEVPARWFVGGLVVSTIGIVTLAQLYFEIPLLYGLLAVAMTFVLSVVSCRVVGESDIAPGGPLGKIMQLTYGVLIPQSSTANLQTAGISAGASHASADLLNDLKTGHLLGAHPRRQFVAQALGIFTGTVASTLAYLVLVPDASALTGTAAQPAVFPAVAAQQWKAVAELFKLGFGNLHPMAQHTMAWSAGLGVVLALAELFAPKSWRKYLPSPTGLGIGMVLPFFYPLAMFLGAGLGAVATAWKKDWADRYLLATAAGAIAGESMVGVIVTAMNTLVLEER